MSFSVLAVLLLVLFAWSAVVMTPGPWDVEAGPSLVAAEEELRAFLASSLDRSLEVALPLASGSLATTLGDALDAALVRRVRADLPSTAGGWEVRLVDVSGDVRPRVPLGSGAAGRAGGDVVAAGSPGAELVVDLVSGGGAGGPVRLTLWVEGGPVEEVYWEGALSGDSGPVSHLAGALLGAMVQSRAISSPGDVDALLGPGDVREVLNATLDVLTSADAPARTGPVSIDLAGLVRQTVEGVVERNLGWLGDYLPWTGALEHLDGAVLQALADLLADVVMGALGVTGGDLPVVEGEDLGAAVEEGMAALERAGSTLEAGAMVAGTTRMLEDAVPGVPGETLGDLASVLAEAATRVASGGLVLAREALIAMGLTGRQVDPLSMASWEGTCVRFRGLSVTTTWRGEKATEPPDLLSLGWSALERGPLPYVSSCRVSVTGDALVEVATEGASGRPLRASWRVPVDLGAELSVVTGRPLGGVVYEPTATLAGDAAAVAGVLWGEATGSLGWLAARFRDAAESACSWAEDLWTDMRGSLMTGSAYTLSRALWGIGESLGGRRVDKAINGTWDLLMDLFGEDLREALTWRVTVLGWDVVVAVDLERQQLDLGCSSGDVSMDIGMRRLCDPRPPFAARPVEGYHWGVFGEARVDAGERVAALHLDPLTLERPSVLTLEVSWGNGTGEGGELVLEAMEAERLSRGWSVRLSDLVGSGWALSMAGGGLADAGVAVHGDLLEEGAARKALERAMKDAWLATMRGWRVGDLLGETGRGPDADSFLQTLMRELEGALTERASTLVSELEVYLEVRFPNPGWPDLRLSLVVSEPLGALLPLAAWAKRWLEPLVGRALSGSLAGPEAAMESWLAERVSLRFELSWAVEVPSWLASRTSSGMPDSVGLVVRGQANVASLMALGGRRAGLWSFSTEVRLRGVPGALLAIVPGMGSPDWEWAEVTLVRATARELCLARLLLSQVMYDAPGRDADLEYVQLLNAGGRMLDLEGHRLVDGTGGFTLRGHLPLLPGDSFLVARNSSAVEARWGALPDLGNMGPRLANDGDVVRLLGPEGAELDMVAWEGYLEGWETLEAGEGLALLRSEGDLRRCQRAAWEVGQPSPVGSGW